MRGTLARPLALSTDGCHGISSAMPDSIMVITETSSFAKQLFRDISTLAGMCVSLTTNGGILSERSHHWLQTIALHSYARMQLRPLHLVSLRCRGTLVPHKTLVRSGCLRPTVMPGVRQSGVAGCGAYQSFPFRCRTAPVEIVCRRRGKIIAWFPSGSGRSCPSSVRMTGLSTAIHPVLA